MLRAILQMSRRRRPVFCARTRTDEIISEPKLLLALIKDRDLELRQLHLELSQLHDKFRKEVLDLQEKGFAELMEFYTELMKTECNLVNQLHDKFRKEFLDLQEKGFAELKKLYTELIKTECNLREVTTNYLQETSSMNVRSVFKMYVNWRGDGGCTEKWHEYVNDPKTEAAQSLKRELEKAKIDISNMDKFVKDVYAILLNDDYMAVKSNTMLFIFSDRLTSDQRTFLKLIAEHVVLSYLIVEVTTEHVIIKK